MDFGERCCILLQEMKRKGITFDKAVPKFCGTQEEAGQQARLQCSLQKAEHSTGCSWAKRQHNHLDSCAMLYLTVSVLPALFSQQAKLCQLASMQKLVQQMRSRLIASMGFANDFKI